MNQKDHLRKIYWIYSERLVQNGMQNMFRKMGLECQFRKVLQNFEFRKKFLIRKMTQAFDQKFEYEESRQFWNVG